MAATELLMPDLGDRDTLGTVVAVLIEPGQDIVPGQPLIEVETDKVTLEVPSDRGGRVERLLVQVGDTTRTGAPFAVVTGAAPAASPERTTPGPQSRAERPAAGPGLQPPAGQAVMAPAPEARPVTSGARAAPPLAGDRAPVPAGPAARREARELGVDIREVPGTGIRGRIGKQDVRRFVRQRLARGPAGFGAGLPAETLPDPGEFGPVRRAPLSRIEQTTARNLTRAALLIPHAWVEQEIDITTIEARRRAIRACQAATDPPLTLTAVICKVVATLLADFPRFNAALDVAAGELVLREYTNIGIAVDTARGLVVPVVRDAAARTLDEIAADIDALSRLARDDRLPPRALRGGGITITNLGGIGASGLQPIIQWPEVAILGVAAIREQPRLRDGVLENRRRLPLTVGFDHRVVNGADAARFLGAIRAALENPHTLPDSSPLPAAPDV